MKYLVEERGLTEATIEQWQLGYWRYDQMREILTGMKFSLEEITKIETACANRITIPIRHVFGTVVGIAGRRIPGDTHPVPYMFPTYVWRRGLIFGADGYVKQQYDPPLPPIVFEGAIDTIMGQQEGFPTVGLLGTSCSREQAMLLRCFNPEVCYFCPDPDEGFVNVLRSVYRQSRFLPPQLMVVQLDKLDPAEQLKQDPERFNEFVREARPLRDFIPLLTKKTGPRKDKSQRSPT